MPPSRGAISIAAVQDVEWARFGCVEADRPSGRQSATESHLPRQLFSRRRLRVASFAFPSVRGRRRGGGCGGIGGGGVFYIARCDIAFVAAASARCLLFDEGKIDILGEVSLVVLLPRSLSLATDLA